MSSAVLLAEPRGYCTSGVDRAVETVERALDKRCTGVRKEIVHNRHVVDTLSERVAVFVGETDEVPGGCDRRFLSAHGCPRRSTSPRRSANLQTIDATCPLVTKVHQEANVSPATASTFAHRPRGSRESGAPRRGARPSRSSTALTTSMTSRSAGVQLVWLSQTTPRWTKPWRRCAACARSFQLQDPPSDDICYATQNRQVAVKAMAKHCELVIVVGSKNSSNSVRLVEVAAVRALHPTSSTTPAEEPDLARRCDDGGRDVGGVGARGSSPRRSTFSPSNGQLRTSRPSTPPRRR